ncbi:Hypothetical protein PFR_JS9-2_1750 [Propionibacterium freudenreichii]|nr:Hypothetical protein PFR_JS9-1_1752 [Propionibacterium freudenreichii]SCQ69951.1 Hypothetical protein PFR_JS9-2_1750 [Propionibacterium freudenreichii]
MGPGAICSISRRGSAGPPCGGLRRIEGHRIDGVERIDVLSGLCLLHRIQRNVTKQRVVLGHEAQLSGGQGFQGRLGAVDRDDLDVLARREPGLGDCLGGAQAHLVVLGEDQLDARVGLQERLGHRLAVILGPVRGLAGNLLELGMGGHHRIPALVAVVHHGQAGRPLQHDVLGALGELLDGPVGRALGDGDVVRGDARGIQRGVVGLNATVQQEDRDLGLLRTVQHVLPAGGLGGRQQDRVDTLIDERGHGGDLGRLVAVVRRGVLQVDAIVLAEGVLDVRLVRRAPAALGTNCHKADGESLRAAARITTATAATASRQGQGKGAQGRDELQ